MGMRALLALPFVLLACSSSRISPDPFHIDGGSDAGLDGSASPDGSISPDAGATKPASFTSGTRLRTRYITGADGSKQLVGFYDSTLKVECTFITAGDGKTRCLPIGGSAAANIAANAYYADSACTQPAAYAAYPLCPTTYAAQGDPSPTSCSTGYTYRVYSLGAKLSTYYVKGGSCTATAVPPTLQMWAVGTEIPPAQFVEGTYATE